MTPTLNDVPLVDLNVFLNSDLVFEAEWWLDEAETEPVNLSGAAGQIRSTGEELMFDFADYITIDDNKALVFVPTADLLATLEELVGTESRWDFLLIAATGERKPFCRGQARIRRGETR